jgi:outer membrane protein assembly factor BamB
MKRLWLCLLTLALAACVPSSPPERVVGPPAPAQRAECLARGGFPPLLPGLRYGVNAFLFGTDQSRTLALASSAGFGWLRQQIHWRDIETRPGGYDWSWLDTAVDATNRAGLRLLLSVVRSPAWATTSGQGGLPDTPAEFAAFMRALSGRYAGRVGAYEIWNEPNLAAENGGVAATPAQYLAALRAAYPAIKQADPCAIVLAAPLSATATDDPAIAADDLRFYRELYALDGGAFLRAADAVAIHPGGGDHAFDARWPAGNAAQSRQYFRHIDEIRQLMEQAGDRRQAWITEVGWTTRAASGGPPPVSPQAQAKNLVGALELTRSAYPWVAAIFVWNLNFPAVVPENDEKSGFGILSPDWSPRPAYLAIQSYLSIRAAAERKAQPQFSAGAPYRLAWQSSVEGKSRAAPVLGPDGTLYVASDPGRLYAFSPAGGLRWLFHAAGSTRDPPALAPDGTLYLGDASGALTALLPDGTLTWQRQLGGAIRGTPQIAGAAIYVATAAGEALRVDLAGQVVWRARLGGAAVAALAQAGSLYVPTEAGDVVALDASGAERWRTSIGHALASMLALIDDPRRGELLLIGDGEGYLSGLDTTTGTIRWRRKLAERVVSETLLPTSALIGAPPLVGASGVLYLGGRDGVLSALSADGTTLWRYASGSDIAAAPSQASDGTLYVGTMGQRLLAIDTNGRLRWQVQLKGSLRSQPVVAPDGTLYASTLGGYLYALAPVP